MSHRLPVPAFLPRVLALSALVVSLGGCTTSTPLPAATSASREIGIASFNMAWAGTTAEFDRYLAVCGAPDVAWCETRARWVRGTTAATPEEEARAATCRASLLAAAGSREALMRIAPCGAYRTGADPAAERSREAYAEKLEGLRATVARLVEKEGVSVLAFQEVSGQAVVEEVLGPLRARFEVCAAPQSSFQTVAFAWDKAVTERPATCTVNDELAVVESKDEPWRRSRPGLALTLTLGGAPVTFLNVHLKSSCASLVSSERYPGRLLTDPAEACRVFNRQVPILERWIDETAVKSPRFVFLGDLNRRIDEEQAANVPKSEVRADGTDPAGPNRADANGSVTTRYLWGEIADGSPALHQVPLSSAASEEACKGFSGLDHIVVSDRVKALNEGKLLSRKVAVEEKPGQRIQTSDHCPRIVRLTF